MRRFRMASGLVIIVELKLRQPRTRSPGASAVDLATLSRGGSGDEPCASANPDRLCARASATTPASARTLRARHPCHAWRGFETPASCRVQHA